MGTTLPLARVSCPVRCGPQPENNLQALFRPSRIAELVQSRGHKAAYQNLLQGEWESHDETLDLPYGGDAAQCSGRPQLQNKFQVLGRPSRAAGRAESRWHKAARFRCLQEVLETCALKFLTYRMGTTLPLARVSCPVRCGPQLESKLQASGRPSRTAGLVQSRGHGDDAVHCSGQLARALSTPAGKQV